MLNTKLWAAADESIFDKLSDLMAVLGSLHQVVYLMFYFQKIH